MRSALIALFLLGSFFPPYANAQTVQATPKVEQESAPIQDNSFLLEEAYNQEDGVIQHISYFRIEPQSGRMGLHTD